MIPTIRNRDTKYNEITNTMSTRIKEINERYRTGPSLYFYQRVIVLRRQHNSIKSFLSDDYALEILYATLVSWDMNSRGAKMKYFDDFKESIISATNELCDSKICYSFGPDSISNYSYA